MLNLNTPAIRYHDSGSGQPELSILDQQQLPQREVWLTCKSPAQMCEYIQQLKVRGAPLGKMIQVYVCETRPLLQGARLTAWELQQARIPYTLLCDNMVGSLMQQGKINKVFVGADRVAVNGDVANKIGTYLLAVLAHYHKVPFYVAAPYTTLDPQCQSGTDITIEQRHADEVRGINGTLSGCNVQARVYNPAFDITPQHLVTQFILDKGLCAPGAISALSRSFPRKREPRSKGTGSSACAEDDGNKRGG